MAAPVFIQTKYFEGRVIFKLAIYPSGDLALRVVSPDGAPVMKATANLSSADIPDDCIAVKDYSENEGLLAELLRLGIVDPPQAYCRQGFVAFPICHLNLESLA